MNDPEAAAVAKAFAHPLRIAFLRELRDRGKLSPSEYAMESGEPLGNVSYHAHTLREGGVITVVDTAKRRGALEHYYSLSGPRAGVVLAVMDLFAAS